MSCPSVKLSPYARFTVAKTQVTRNVPGTCCGKKVRTPFCAQCGTKVERKTEVEERDVVDEPGRLAITLQDAMWVINNLPGDPHHYWLPNRAQDGLPPLPCMDGPCDGSVTPVAPHLPAEAVAAFLAFYKPHLAMLAEHYRCQPEVGFGFIVYHG